MSSDTLMRILCETSDRMHAAKDAAELRRIGIDHVRALGADLAATAFLQIASNSVFSREQQALFLMHTLGEMIESIEGSFIRQSVRDTALLADHMEAAETGFVNRLDELFSVVRSGGQA